MPAAVALWHVSAQRGLFYASRARRRLGWLGTEIDMKTNKLVWITGLSLLLACGGGDDGGGDTNAMTVGMTLGGTAADGGGTAADDGNGSETAAADDDGADDGMDSTMGADDGMDDAMDDGAGCDPPCAMGEECIAGQCFGGDDGSTGEPPAECGTNVMLMDPECDECVKGACCEAMQACFGDETVAMATPCFELNNCVAMNCTMAASAMELQTCAEENCPETASELNTLLAFLGCSSMSCMAACAG